MSALEATNALTKAGIPCEEPYVSSADVDFPTTAVLCPGEVWVVVATGGDDLMPYAVKECQKAKERGDSPSVAMGKNLYASVTLSQLVTAQDLADALGVDVVELTSLCDELDADGAVTLTQPEATADFETREGGTGEGEADEASAGTRAANGAEAFLGESVCEGAFSQPGDSRHAQFASASSGMRCGASNDFSFKVFNEPGIGVAAEGVVATQEVECDSLGYAIAFGDDWAVQTLDFARSEGEQALKKLAEEYGGSFFSCGVG